MQILHIFAATSVLLFDVAPEPRQATSVSAEFRSGQTFLTWQQPAGEGARYRIYRSTKPFTVAEALTPQRLVGEVHDHTSLNLMASIDRVALSNTRRPQEYKIPQRVYFVIREGQSSLTHSTGLFVYTTKSDETAFYAVIAVVDGVEQRSLVPGPAGNALSAGVAERMEPAAAVRQSDEADYVHWTDNVGTQHYPAMSSLPSVAYNFRVHAPRGPGPFPLVGFLHGALLQYNRISMDPRDLAGAVRVALDSPVIRGRIDGLADEEYPNGGWYGYNSNFGTGRPLTDGKVQDYDVRRVLWTLEWIEKNYSIDPDRVSLRGGSMGGGGCLTIGLLHPERFAAIHAFIPYLPSRRRGGGESPESPIDFIARHPESDFPYLLATVGRTDNIVGWPNKLELAQAAQQSQTGFTLYWDLRNHNQQFAGDAPQDLPGPAVYWGRTGGQPEASLAAFSRNQSYPAIAKLTANSDPGTVDFGVRPDRRPDFGTPGAGELIGSINGWVDWDRTTIVDTPARYEITLRLLSFAKSDEATAQITPRRLQSFRAARGDRCSFQVIAIGSGELRSEGTLTADEFGRVTVERVPITKQGCRLVITPTR